MICFNKCLPIWDFTFLFAMFASLILFFLTVIILRLTLDFSVRKALPSDRIYNSPLDWYGGFIRTMGFGYAAVFDRINNVGMKEYYDGINVKNIASLFEKIIAYIFVCSSGIFVFGIAFYFITETFGFIDWSEPV